MRSRDRESNLLRVVPELRETIEFRRLNLMEEFGMAEMADAIFCRNVIIYFDRPTQERLFHKLSRQLVDGGYMFVGHSESLHHMESASGAGRSRSLQENRWPKSQLSCRRFYLQPGEVHLARSPAILKTVLGSCVGVTFWSPRLGIGALCHGVLPRCPPGVRDAEGYRYVDFAISDLARQFEMLRRFAARCRSRCFGGADVLPVHADLSWKATVGHQNWHTALEVLHEQKLHRAAPPTWEARSAALFNSIPEPAKCCFAGSPI